MAEETPIIDKRTSEDIYRQSLLLAREYCPQWAASWPDESDFFDSDDDGMVMLKLFSRLAETVLSRLNKVPEKHRLAFLDFIGLEYQPPKPARVPLTFSLAKGAVEAMVPSGTKVASSEDGNTIFETLEFLSVVDSGFSSLYSLNPWNDAYTDLSSCKGGEGDFLVFGGDKREEPLNHVLFLGDTNLFDIRRKTQISLTLAGSNLEKEYFSQWSHGEGNTISVDDSAFPALTFEVDSINKSTVDGSENFWLEVRPSEDIQIKGNPDALPSLNSVKAAVTVEEIIPEAVVCNNVPQDPKKGFYPFGERPGEIDTFYIGCEEAFSKTDALVAISMTSAKVVAGATAVLKWEYWDGKSWSPLDVTDGTANFTQSGIVSFTVPNMELLTVNSMESRWIRASISSGGYGHDVQYSEMKTLEEIFSGIDFNEKDAVIKELEAENVTFGFKFSPASYNPPYITSIKLSATFSLRDVKSIIRHNSFQYEVIDTGKVEQFAPYLPAEDEMPSLYFGFDKKVGNNAVNLYFALKERLFGDEETKITSPLLGEEEPDFQNEASLLLWQYYNGSSWQELGIDDETKSFDEGGIVSFLMPGEMETLLLFGKERYWIRATYKEGKWLACPQFKGVFPNTVWAVNCITQESELLGSGRGEPNLVLHLSKFPVLQGQQIEINEAVVPSGDELNVIEKEEGKGALRIEKNAKGAVESVWVRWHEVRDFTASEPLSRHYVVDRVRGRVIFGDGKRGIVAPRGKNNIVCRYKSGGGNRGNVDSNSLTSLKRNIPNIDTVTNPVSAAGGTDLESEEELIKRGTHSLKNRNRAVTAEDFEYLALSFSPLIYKARCFENDDKKIVVIIIPIEKTDEPRPSTGLIDSVENHLKERCLIPIQNRVQVVAPKYIKVHVEAGVKPVSLTEAPVVAEKLSSEIKAWLHPLTGGDAGKGWDFGAEIHLTKLASLIEAVEGVDYVKSLKIIIDGEEFNDLGYALVERDALPSAGDITIIMET